jgi:hypothetical protein
MDRSSLISNVLHGVTKILSTPSQEFSRHRLENLQVIIFQTVSEKSAAADQCIPEPVLISPCVLQTGMKVNGGPERITMLMNYASNESAP